MDKLERHYGKRPIIYTAPDFYADNLSGEFLDYPFWLRSVAAHPSKRYPGRKWVFWQYSGSGLSQGVERQDRPQRVPRQRKAVARLGRRTVELSRQGRSGGA